MRADTAIVMAPRVPPTSQTRFGSLKRSASNLHDINGDLEEDDGFFFTRVIRNPSPIQSSSRSSSLKASQSKAKKLPSSSKPTRNGQLKAQTSTQKNKRIPKKTKSANGSINNFSDAEDNAPPEFSSEEEPPPPPSPPVPPMTRKRGPQKLPDSPENFKRKRARTKSKKKDTPTEHVPQARQEPATKTRSRRQKVNSETIKHNNEPVSTRASRRIKQAASEIESDSALRPDSAEEPDDLNLVLMMSSKSKPKSVKRKKINNTAIKPSSQQTSSSSRYTTQSLTRNARQSESEQETSKNSASKHEPSKPEYLRTSRSQSRLNSSSMVTSANHEQSLSRDELQLNEDPKSLKQNARPRSKNMMQSKLTVGTNQLELVRPNSKRLANGSADSQSSVRRPQSQHSAISQNSSHFEQPPYSPTDPKHPSNTTQTTQISLPVSDTPIIRRNQEMRRQQDNLSNRRRSSMSQRGKRTSSIGNGFVAVPHESIKPSNFFKHLDKELPEPHQLKQLLVWSAKRLLESKYKENSKQKSDTELGTEEKTAIRMARFIQEEIVRDLADGKIAVSWWNRQDSEEEQSGSSSNKQEPEKLKPNVHNVTNLQNLRAYERKVKELQQEKEKWAQELLRAERMSEAVQKLKQDDQITKYNFEKTTTRVRANNGADDEQIDQALKNSLERFSSIRYLPQHKKGPEDQNMLQKVLQEHPVLQTGLGVSNSKTKEILQTNQEVVSSMCQEAYKLFDFAQQTDAVARTSDAYSKTSMRAVALELNRNKEAKDYERQCQLVLEERAKKTSSINNEPVSPSLNQSGQESEFDDLDINNQSLNSVPLSTKDPLKNSDLASVIMKYVKDRDGKKSVAESTEPRNEPLENDSLVSKTADSLHELSLTQAKKPDDRYILLSISRLQNMGR